MLATAEESAILNATSTVKGKSKSTIVITKPSDPRQVRSTSLIEESPTPSVNSKYLQLANNNIGFNNNESPLSASETTDCESSPQLEMDQQRKRKRKAHIAANARKVSESAAEEASTFAKIEADDQQPKTFRQDALTYEEARAYLGKDPQIAEVTEHRHITLGWHCAGKVKDTVSRSVFTSIGQHRTSIDAVPIAIGDIKCREPLFILQDDNCIHVDVDVRMIVFRSDDKCVGNRVIEGMARFVQEGQMISGTAYGSLGMVCSPPVPGVKPGDRFKSRFMGTQIRHGIFQIRTSPLNVTRFEDAPRI